MDMIRFLVAATCPPPLKERMARCPQHRASNGELVNLSGPGPYICSREAFNSVRKAYRGAFVLYPARPAPAVAPVPAPASAAAPAEPTAAAPAEPTPGSAELRRDMPANPPKTASKAKGKAKGKKETAAKAGKPKAEEPAVNEPAADEATVNADQDGK